MFLEMDSEYMLISGGLKEPYQRLDPVFGILREWVPDWIVYLLVL